MPASERVRRLIHTRLAAPEAVSPETALILDVLGLAPELSVSNCVAALEHAVRPEVLQAELERLEGDGVIDVLTNSGALRLRIRDAVIELVLPQTIGVLRRRRLASVVVDQLAALSPDDLGGGELEAIAKHSVMLERPVEPETLIGAAVAALQASRFELALQLASVASRGDDGFDAQLVMAAAESRLGHGLAALDRLSGLEAAAAGHPERLAALTTLTDVVRAQLDRPSFGWDLRAGASIDSSQLDLASLFQLDSAREDMAQARPGPGEIGDRLHDVLEGERHLQDAAIAMLKGDMSGALAHLDAGEAMFAAVSTRSWGLMLHRVFAESLDGRMGESVDAALKLVEQAAAEGQPVHQAKATWLAGHCLLYSGRLTEAVDTLLPAQAMMDQFGISRAAHVARAEAAIALAQLGDVAAAEATVAPVLAAQDDHFMFAATALQATGWIHVASGRFDEAVASFIEAGDAFDALGYRRTAVVPLVEAARAGAARRVMPRLEEREHVIQGSNGPLLIRQARALARLEALEAEGGEPEAWAAAAGAFEAVGAELASASLHLNSAEAYSRAAVVYGQVGQDRQAAAASRCADHELAVCGTAGWLLLPAHVSLLLSGREQEIATLAVAGQSNREIADILVLSVRTVETHLQRVYRKLGVRGRSELADALPGGATGAVAARRNAID